MDPRQAMIDLAERPSTTEEDVLALVREIIDRDGDIRTDIVQAMSMCLPVSETFELRVQQMRAAHFRRLGRNVPDMPGPAGLE